MLVENHPHCALDFCLRCIPASSCHVSILSRVGVSGKPVAVQFATAHAGWSLEFMQVKLDDALRFRWHDSLGPSLSLSARIRSTGRSGASVMFQLEPVNTHEIASTNNSFTSVFGRAPPGRKTPTPCEGSRSPAELEYVIRPQWPTSSGLGEGANC